MIHLGLAGDGTLSAMTATLTAALACLDRGEPAVLVTVSDVWGSAPREAGAAMLVTADAIAGTIGGGHLEWRAIEAARGCSFPRVLTASWRSLSARRSPSAAAAKCG